MQDIFFQLWHSPSRFSSRGSLAAWLRVIARNRAISRLRRPDPGGQLADNSVVLPFQLDGAVAERELLERVKTALEKLPRKQQVWVELAYFEGLTHSETAARTGDSARHGKEGLRSAVETLKHTLHSEQS